MSKKSKQEYTEAVKSRYLAADKDEKKIILDEYCKVCGYNRKYAIRLLNKPPDEQSKSGRSGRKKIYDSPAIMSFLKKLWISTNLICSKRLKEIIPLWIRWYKNEECKLSKEEAELLKKISAATIDRLLNKYRKQYVGRGYSTTKPGSILKEFIPVKTEQWDETRPGYIEADTVAHCGSSVSGSFIYTLNIVDIATGWTSQRAVWGKGETGILRAIKSIENSLPFEILGFDCDNGYEFMNWALFYYFKNRKRPVGYTRSREYKKNDNAHIEGKNWTIVRQYLHYERLDKPEMVMLLNDLYTKELNCMLNYFLPSVKLIAKQRIGSKIIKVHDKPKTPFQRLLESGVLEKKRELKIIKLIKQINPFELKKEIEEKIKRILELAKK